MISSKIVNILIGCVVAILAVFIYSTFSTIAHFFSQSETSKPESSMDLPVESDLDSSEVDKNKAVVLDKSLPAPAQKLQKLLSQKTLDDKNLEQQIKVTNQRLSELNQQLESEGFPVNKMKSKNHTEPSSVEERLRAIQEHLTKKGS